MSRPGASSSKRTRSMSRTSTCRTAAVTTLLSFEEFEQLPDEPGKVELLDGELIQSPPAKFKHSELVRRIYVRLVPAEIGRAASKMLSNCPTSPAKWSFSTEN